MTNQAVPLTVERALSCLVRDAQLFVKDNERGADVYYELAEIEAWAATIRDYIDQQAATIDELQAALTLARKLYEIGAVSRWLTEAGSIRVQIDTALSGTDKE